LKWCIIGVEIEIKIEIEIIEVKIEIEIIEVEIAIEI